jgi:predicted 2-oxoglutarate/Fe(II)-dependent dioxygenase YbiX
LAQLPLPPWRRLTDVLAPQALRTLLDWTLANEAAFKPSRVTGGGYAPDIRVSDRVKNVGPMRALLEPHLRGLWPEIAAAAGSKPFEPDHVELEIAAHGDGAFFRPHHDLPVGAERRPKKEGALPGDRVVSAVFYYHCEPRGFSGGALRLYRFGARTGEDAREGEFVDIEPIANSLVAFPSWAVHEVRPVSCPSGRFEDRRFAVNIWFRREIAVDK